MKKTTLIFRILLVSLSFLSLSCHAGWRDWFSNTTSSDKTGQQERGKATLTPVRLSNSDIIGGLKEALNKAADYSVSTLGKSNGFMGNSRVRIPMPGKLLKVEKALRSVGASRYADEFVTTMNRAAEKAIIKARPIFIRTIRDMTIRDGMDILKGPDDSATQYFRSKTSTNLTNEMLPVTKQMTNSAGVTTAYKKMISNLGFAGKMLGEDEIDLDSYITRKTLDGLFYMIAVEEKKIRTNPVARTSDLLRKVFGSL